MPAETPAVLAERRQNLALRSLFEEAYARIEACFDPKQTWGGLPLEHLAFRMLRETYPQLPPNEVHLLVRASLRVYRTRNPGRAGHLPRPEEIVPPQ